MARKIRPPADPNRRIRSRDDSLLLRSAASLGRVIGELQRQLDVLTRKMTGAVGADAKIEKIEKARRMKQIEALAAKPVKLPKVATRTATAKPKGTTRPKKGASASKSGAKPLRRKP